MPVPLNASPPPPSIDTGFRGAIECVAPLCWVDFITSTGWKRSPHEHGRSDCPPHATTDTALRNRRACARPSDNGNEAWSWIFTTADALHVAPLASWSNPLRPKIGKAITRTASRDTRVGASECTTTEGLHCSPLCCANLAPSYGWLDFPASAKPALCKPCSTNAATRMLSHGRSLSIRTSLMDQIRHERCGGSDCCVDASDVDF